jgi:hypothetical protein
VARIEGFQSESKNGPPSRENAAEGSMTEHALIKVPEWDGHPREAAEVWTLRKGARVAVCTLWTHPKGGEARLTVDGEWRRGEAGRDGMALMDRALERKATMVQKGWA